MMPFVRLVLCGAAGLLAGALTACLCDRDGCRSFDDPFGDPTITTGVAGTAASVSDDVRGTCRPCPVGSGTLRLWSAPNPVTDKAGAEALILEAPLHLIEFDGEFQQELEPGDYLACFEKSGPGGFLCGAFGLEAGDVVTLNHKGTHGGVDQIAMFSDGADKPGGNTWDL